MVVGDLREVRSVDEIRKLKARDFPRRIITQEEFEHVCRLFDAFWEYRGIPRPEKPHALLKSGLHSDGFINCSEVLKESNLCEYFGQQLLRRVREVYNGPIDWAIGAAYAGIDLAHEVARQVLSQKACKHAFTEKDTQGNPTKWGRFTIPSGEHVLIVNELMTTAEGSTYETKAAVQQKNKEQPVTFVPCAAVLVNRSKDAEKLADGTEVISLVRYKMANVEPDKCLHCSVGSPALKPKVEGNWEKYFSG